ncbi:unnamed protein product [Phyllotreta striolata]|uniref:Uncharacterized protein n=1 Tax=Phyllotreta striolata TaxID=444603 RepID=A0A9N9TNZ0_PHYSR|nr:unnamed protein product [Phyllotreta striolata]
MIQLSKFPLFSTVLKTYEQARRYKRVLGDKVRELDETTLTGRLLAYVSHPTEQINAPKRSESKIERIKKSIESLDTGGKASKHHFLQTVDEQCTRELKQMSTLCIFDVLHALTKKIPNRITESEFYERSLQELAARLPYLSKNEVIQYIFYMGLKKKNNSNNQILKKCLNKLSKSGLSTLTAEDLCVICNSTFKTTTKINDQFLSTVIAYIQNNLHLFKDPALLVTYLKSIRQNRYQNEEFLSTISYTILFNKTAEHYSFSALCHILALYSDYLYYDENVLRHFCEKSIDILRHSSYTTKTEHMSIQSRLKDIKRLLWCLSNLNYTKLPASDIKDVIIPSIVQRVEAGDVEENYTSLIEIALYLWMLNYKSHELMPYFLRKTVIQPLLSTNSPIKQRLNLLLTCLFYEDKTLLKESGVYPKFNSDYDMMNQLKKRPALKKVMDNLAVISKRHDLNKFQMNCQIPGLNIIGITGYKKKIYKTAYLEILDEYTTLKNTDNSPTGPMQLKLRLLERMDEAVILIDSNEIEGMSDKDVQRVLLEEIEFVC